MSPVSVNNTSEAQREPGSVREPAQTAAEEKPPLSTFPAVLVDGTTGSSQSQSERDLFAMKVCTDKEFTLA